MDPNPSGLTRRSFVLGSFGAATLAAWHGLPTAAATAQELQTPDCSYVPWQSRDLLSSTQLKKASNELAAQGYRLTDLSGYDVRGNARHAGIWEQRPAGPTMEWFSLQTRAALLAEWDRLVREGYRPVRLTGYVVGNTVFFASIWEQRTSPEWQAFIDLTREEYRRQHDRLKKRGYRPVDLSGYAVGSDLRFACIFEKRTQTVAAKAQLTRAELNSEHDQLTSSGHRLVHLRGYGVGPTPYYAAIWELSSGPEQVLSPHMTRNAFRLHVDEMRYRGFRPVSLPGFDINQSDRYAAAWDRHGLSADQEGELANAVTTFMHGWDNQAVMSPTPAVPGLSLAFAKNGRLVYARGFGAAKVGENGAPDEPVTVHNQFRIASVSKSVTAVAVMKLVDQGVVNLDDKVFGEDSWLGARYPITRTTHTDELGSASQIQVGHLLAHTAGGWQNDGTKLVWDPADLSQDELIDHVLNSEIPNDQNEMVPEYPLSSKPGDVFGYSGFGYVLLARIIEAATSRTYEDYVQQEVMGGSGTIALASNTIDSGTEVRHYAEFSADTTLAADILAADTSLTVASSAGFESFYWPFTVIIDREKLEVRSVSGTTWAVERGLDKTVASDHDAGAVVQTPPARDPYSFDVARADGGGGLVATAIDLVRLVTLVDGHPPPPPDLLSETTRRMMVTASAASESEPDPWPYGLGWILDKPESVAYYGGGSLEGTNSIMCRRRAIDGDVYCWAGLINTRIERPTTMFTERLWNSDLFVPMLSFFSLVDIDSWPCYDLF